MPETDIVPDYTNDEIRNLTEDQFLDWQRDNARRALKNERETMDSQKHEAYTRFINSVEADGIEVAHKKLVIDLERRPQKDLSPYLLIIVALLVILVVGLLIPISMFVPLFIGACVLTVVGIAIWGLFDAWK